MLSRVANSLYWLNRYVERAENYARLASVSINLTLDFPQKIDSFWESLLLATADKAYYFEIYNKITHDDLLKFISFDKNNPNSILSCVEKARENARSMKDKISKEMWEHINGTYLKMNEQKQDSIGWRIDDYQLFFDEVKMSCQLFFGIVDSTITRDATWHFSQMGKLIERSDKTSRFLDIRYFIEKNNDFQDPTTELLLWSATLKSVSAYNMYRQKYGAVLSKNVIDFLINDIHFPRSIAYGSKAVKYSIKKLYSGNKNIDLLESKLLEIEAVIKVDLDAKVNINQLHLVLDKYQKLNNELDSLIFDHYFKITD